MPAMYYHTALHVLVHCGELLQECPLYNILRSTIGTLQTMDTPAGLQQNIYSRCKGEESIFEATNNCPGTDDILKSAVTDDRTLQTKAWAFKVHVHVPLLL